MCVFQLLVFAEAGHVVNTCFELLPFPTPPSGNRSCNSFPLILDSSHPLLLDLTIGILNGLFIHSIVCVEKHGLTDSKIFPSTKNLPGFYRLFRGPLVWNHLPLETRDRNTWIHTSPGIINQEMTLIKYVTVLLGPQFPHLSRRSPVTLGTSNAMIYLNYKLILKSRSTIILILCSHQGHTKRQGTDVAVRGFGADSGKNGNAPGHGRWRGAMALPRGLAEGPAADSGIYYVPLLCGQTLRELFSQTREGV